MHIHKTRQFSIKYKYRQNMFGTSSVADSVVSVFVPTATVGIWT